MLSTTRWSTTALLLLLLAPHPSRAIIGGRRAFPLSSQQQSVSDIGVVRADTLIQEVFSGGGEVDATVVVGRMAKDVEFHDLCLSKPLRGREEVRAHLENKFLPETRFTVERIADGKTSSGFTWMYQGSTLEDAKFGLRGTTYLETSEAGEITYWKEACEPLFKPGAATADLLKAITAEAAKELELNGKPAPTYVEQTPTTAKGVVDYLWKEAYPKGADTDEALRLFAENIVYEDFNVRYHE